MICQKCGSNVNPGEIFCRNCGVTVETKSQNNEVESELNNSSIFLPPENMVEINKQDDNDLLSSYVGKNYEKFKEGKGLSNVSWCTLFFGPAYILYRKMWITAALWLSITLLIGIFLKNYMYISVVLNTMMALFFKKIYIDNAKKEIKEIKEKNPNIERDKLLELCKKEGGTSVGIMIVVIIIYLVVAFLLGATIVGTPKDKTNPKETDNKKTVEKNTVSENITSN